MNYIVYCDRKHTVHIDRRADTTKPFTATVDKEEHSVAIRKVQEDGAMKTLLVDHRVVPIEIERRGDGMPVRVFLKGVPYNVEISKVASTRFKPEMPEREVSGEVRASLPGQIVELAVREGDSVLIGAPLGILDAMKMENEILSPKAGVVRRVAVAPGQVLAKGDLILEIG